jgi:hypothetical protein
MMFKVDASTLEEFAADPGRDADLRVVERRAGTGHRPAGAVCDGTVRTGERGAL